MTHPERIVVTGATGLIGRKLCAKLTAAGYQVTVFSRNPDKARRTLPGMADYISWDAQTPGDWISALDGAAGIVHLAGASIFDISKRWTEAYKQVIYNSRINSTRVLVNAMNTVQNKPRAFVSGSGVTYYGETGDTQIDENAPPGDLFLSKVCCDWEQEALRAQEAGIRTVVVRTGVVLDAKEGALSLLTLPFRFFLGGPILPGTQYMSWIHIDDEVGLLLFALQDERIQGPLNATAPDPQTNDDLTRKIGKAMKSPAWLPVPGFAVKLVLGELADNVLASQRAMPQKALDHGYTFAFPTAEQALQDLLA